MATGDVERVQVGGRCGRIQDHVLLCTERRDVQPCPGAANADTGLRDHALRIPHGLVVGDDVVTVLGEHLVGEVEDLQRRRDLAVLPADAETAVVDPVLAVPTLNLICDVYDPLSRKPYGRDPRYASWLYPV